jgi:Tfp pilus assembly protein PilV
MSMQMTIELTNQSGIQAVLQALELYKRQLRANIKRTREHLRRFEQQYHVTTAYFLTQMAAEDLAGGDLEYVEWAGEADMLAGLQAELQELENARYRLP